MKKTNSQSSNFNVLFSFSNFVWTKFSSISTVLLHSRKFRIWLATICFIQFAYVDIGNSFLTSRSSIKPPELDPMKCDKEFDIEAVDPKCSVLMTAFARALVPVGNGNYKISFNKATEEFQLVVKETNEKIDKKISDLEDSDRRHKNSFGLSPVSKEVPELKNKKVGLRLLADDFSKVVDNIKSRYPSAAAFFSSEYTIQINKTEDGGSNLKFSPTGKSGEFIEINTSSKGQSEVKVRAYNKEGGLVVESLTFDDQTKIGSASSPPDREPIQQQQQAVAPTPVAPRDKQLAEPRVGSRGDVSPVNVVETEVRQAQVDLAALAADPAISSLSSDTELCPVFGEFIPCRLALPYGKRTADARLPATLDLLRQNGIEVKDTGEDLTLRCPDYLLKRKPYLLLPNVYKQPRALHHTGIQAAFLNCLDGVKDLEIKEIFKDRSLSSKFIEKLTKIDRFCNEEVSATIGSQEEGASPATPPDSNFQLKSEGYSEYCTKVQESFSRIKERCSEIRLRADNFKKDPMFCEAGDIERYDAEKAEATYSKSIGDPSSSQGSLGGIWNSIKNFFTENDYFWSKALIGGGAVTWLVVSTYNSQFKRSLPIVKPQNTLWAPPPPGFAPGLGTDGAILTRPMSRPGDLALQVLERKPASTRSEKRAAQSGKVVGPEALSGEVSSAEYQSSSRSRNLEPTQPAAKICKNYDSL